MVEIEAAYYKRVYGSAKEPHDTLNLIRELGYTIIQRTGHEGKHMSPEQHRQLMTMEYERESESELPNGAQGSSVVVCIKNG